MTIRDYEFGTGVGTHDFKATFNREPRDQNEMDEFGSKCERAMQFHIDWDIIFECVKDDWMVDNSKDNNESPYGQD